MAENLRTCAACGTANEEDARFCESCGGALARVCATCGLQSRPTARFCRGCGAPLEDATSDAGTPVRKTVSVMFADLAGSTAFEESVDAETAREVIGRYHALLRTTADRYRAGVVKYIGDGFMAVWGVPDVGPDDAVRAVDAAVALQERFVELAGGVAAAHGVELGLRVAVNTGEVVVGADDADLVGDALNVGARLESVCPLGRVVVGEETWRATRTRNRFESLGHIQVKGRTAPVAVYEWTGRQSDTADTTPLVGRADEVRRLTAALDGAVLGRTARLVTVIGDPGVGKTRLATEFAASVAGTVLKARCDVEGTVALAPLVELLRGLDLDALLPQSASERDRLVRDLTGLTAGVPGSVEETFWALRRFVEVLGASGPVVLVLDDIQWADALLLDFIEHLVEWVRDSPLLILALARTELRELRPDLVTASRWVSEAIHLDGLDAQATAELAARVLGADQLPAELLHRLPASTGGNPLFVRELIGMLAHDGVLVEWTGGWRLTIDVDAIAIPPTIHALLASRLERLDPADRRLLEVAAVAGYDFTVDAVAALLGIDAAVITSSLTRLRRVDLVEPSGAYVGDEPVWRFHHVLIRDVAYRRLLKSDRAELHERLADWVQARGGAAFESDEATARHLEAAHSYRVQLGRPDGGLALRAARHYATSARRALDRDELISAGAQAARGAALACGHPAVHADLLLIGCEAFLSAGDVASGAPLVDELDRVADDALRPWAVCYRSQLTVYTDPERLPEADAALQDAIDEFGRRQDPAGLAKAHRVRASARMRLGRIADGEADLFEALIAARRSGDHRQITAALGAAPNAALWGPSPVPKAGGRCLDVVRMQRMTTAAPSLEATSLRCLAVLELLRGRPEKARAMLAEARQVVADLGLRHGLMETEMFAGIIEAMEGDFVAAEPHFRAAMEGLEALGVGIDAGQAAALLARSVLAQGRVEEADRYAADSEQMAGRNLKTGIAWRAVRAEILAAQGRYDDAAAMARDAVAVAAGTDLVLDHAEACLSLNRVLIAAGDVAAAETARREADRLYAAKEVTTGVGRRVAPPPEAPSASRLVVSNRSCAMLETAVSSVRDRDLERALAPFAENIVYEDHRRLGGLPVVGRDAFRRAILRIFEQYTEVEARVLAVRGELLNLQWNRWSDDAGNETESLVVIEIDDDGLVRYHGRYDVDDFHAAYAELEHRYYAGEGAPYAVNGLAAARAMKLLDDRDFDTLFGELMTPDVQVESRSSRGFPVRSSGDYRHSTDALDDLLSSRRTWISAVNWLSADWSVIRLDREAIGRNGEEYAWTMLLVTEHRDGRMASICEFAVDDEDAAFAYAEERMRAKTSRLAVSNRAADTMAAVVTALAAADVDAATALFADDIAFDDHRALAGDPIDDMRAATERVVQHYRHFQWRPVAVRGERLLMAWSRWSDDAGNESCHLHVQEVDEAGRIAYEGRFDADDFYGAYAELDHRYYAGEGAPFAANGLPGSKVLKVLNDGDFATLSGELSVPGLRVESRSARGFPDRSAAALQESFGHLGEMIVSRRTWTSAIRWLSATCCVVRMEREATGRDGEEYTWSMLLVSEHHDGLITSVCEFDADDEDAAFACVEELMRRQEGRLAVSNRCSRTVENFLVALVEDVDAAFACVADPYEFDDRRQLPGTVIGNNTELREAVRRIKAQYTTFDYDTVAVRGDRLCLVRGRWSDDAGNETGYLHVFELDDDGLLAFEARFDEDDFDGAYRELERRYCADEGAEFANGAMLTVEFIAALNRGEYSRVFETLVHPDLLIENRSSGVFPNRSMSELQTTYEQLSGMVATLRSWNSAVCWVSPQCCVGRYERRALGRGGEPYTWTRIYVTGIRGGRICALCEFELDDEDAALAYAEELIASSPDR
ncbi:ATP-binding protein [Mycolicibacterium phlei]